MRSYRYNNDPLIDGIVASLRVGVVVGVRDVYFKDKFGTAC